MTMLSWLGQNWKPVLSTVAAVALTTAGAVKDIKGEIQDNTDSIEEVNIRMDALEENVRQSNCILVAQATGNPATDCIDTSRR